MITINEYHIFKYGTHWYIQEYPLSSSDPKRLIRIVNKLIYNHI